MDTGRHNAVWVSVIIVCHNDGKWLPRCLESLRAQTIIDRLEVIVADNASQDGTDKLAQKLIATWAAAHFFPTGGDNGFGVACNRAAELATGKYLYLLNPDTWLEPDCIEQLYTIAESRGAGIACGRVLEYDDDSVQSEGSRGFDLCGNAMAVQPGAETEFLLSPGSFFFVRRELFLRVGMMDQQFFLYGEEIDLSWRVWIAGETVVPAPTSRIHHRGGVNVNPGTGTGALEYRTSLQKRFLANRNRLLFLAKDSQHLLLLLLLPCLATTLLEGLATWVMTRNGSLAKATSLEAITDCWRLRAHIRAERQRIGSFRRRSDWWMLRFFRPGFGRWAEISKILKGGFPRFN